MSFNASPSNRIEYREIDPWEYREAILSKFNNTFNRKVSLEQFRWKYIECTPNKMRTWAAFNIDKNSIVGFFSAFKMQFLKSGETIECYQMSDAMIDKAYRSQGIFSKLTEIMLKDLSKENIFWVHAYVNKFSGRILMRHNKAICLATSRSMYYPLGFENLCRFIKGKSKFLSSIEKFLSSFMRLVRNEILHLYPSHIVLKRTQYLDFKQCENHISTLSRHCFFPKRSIPFLRWKTVNVPDSIKKSLFLYSVLYKNIFYGYCVLFYEKERNILKIIDFLIFDEKLISPLLNCVKKIAISMKADGILANIGSSFFQDSFRLKGFFRGKKSDCIILDINNRLCGELLNDSFWYQMLIDRDTFFY
jgi:hypothetical protein